MKDLTKGKESSVIFKFAMPMLIGNVFQQLYNMVDSVIVGNYISNDALAAVGASFYIIFSICALIIGITIGASVVVSQYFGAKQFDKVRLTSDTINIFLFFAAIVISLVGWYFSEDLFRLLGTKEHIIPMATEYFDILILASAVPMFGYNGLAAMLRGVGNSKTPLYFLIISTFLNIVLDYVFVVYFGWGIKGVAWATVIAIAFTWVAMIIYLYRTQSMVRLSLKHLKFDNTIFKQSLRVGLPSGVQQTLVGIGGSVLVVIVNRFDENVLPAFIAAGRVDAFIAMPAMNFAAALSGFVGQNIAVGHFDRIKRGLRSTLILSNLACVIMTALILIFGEDIMRLFVDADVPDSAEVVRIGKEYLLIICSFYFLFCTMFTLNGVARGAGATFIPMFITIISLWFIRVPAAYLLSNTMGEVGIWWSIPLGWAVGCAGAIIYYLSGHWKKSAIVHRNPTPEEQVENPDVAKDFTARI